MSWDKILSQYQGETLVEDVLNDIKRLRRAIDHREYRLFGGLLKDINAYRLARKEVSA